MIGLHRTKQLHLSAVRRERSAEGLHNGRFRRFSDVNTVFTRMLATLDCKPPLIIAGMK